MRCGGVGDVEAHELEPPLGDMAGGLPVADDVIQATGRHDHHRVGVEVVLKLALGDEHGIEELWDPRVPGLRVREDLADEVHQPLDLEDVALLPAFHHQSCANNVQHGDGVEEHSLPH